MGKKSVKENKNIYFRTREDIGLTRAQASELLGYISESRLEKIENEKAEVHPEDVVAMADAYKKPALCNYYCANECRIGKEAVPEIKMTSLPEIVLGTLACLNDLEKSRDRLIDITADSRITDDELADFIRIHDQLDKITLAADSLKLWLEEKMASGEIDPDAVERIRRLK